MCGNGQVIRYLQANKILALKLVHAAAWVGHEIMGQIDMIGSGARRALYYISCFTDEYNDVCQQQKKEDLRFALAIAHMFRHGDILFEMLRIYFEELFQFQTRRQLENIQRAILNVNNHIATGRLTASGCAFAAATAVRGGLRVQMHLSALAGRTVGKAVGGAALYGIVQKAADSANRLRNQHLAYYAALRRRELEMLYFLLEPVFERSGALNPMWLSDDHISYVIAMMAMGL